MFSLKKRWLAPLLIGLFSLLLLLPQLLYRASILGSDSLFHFNRFYDTAMQIKTGNSHYIISLFGFQQSGRIVNALYGPAFAYLQGLLVLLSGTWFRYQLLSRFLLSLTAGLGLYKLLRLAKVKQNLALPLALLFLTTFSVQYWSIRQGFSSWGVALFPWCLMPAIKVLDSKRVKPVPLAMAVAVMLQVHSLSTLFLVVSYLPFYLYAWSKSEKPLKFLAQGLVAVALCLLLTANVWYPLISIGQANQLVQPFINKELASYTIDRYSSKLLLQPLGLAAILLGNTYFSLKFRKTNRPIKRLVGSTSLLFLLLASSLFPWDELAGRGLQAVELIQFPFRFFLIATPLLLLYFGISASLLGKWQSRLSKALYFLSILGLVQVVHHHHQLIQKNYLGDYPIEQRRHTYFLEDADSIRQAIHSDNLGELLEIAVKSTPDYLPLYQETKKNKYKLYDALVIEQEEGIDKETSKTSISLSWTSEQTESKQLPIVLYKGSQINLNGKTLDLTQTDLSAIGTPTITSQPGKNSLQLTYPISKPIKVSLITTALSWLGLATYGISPTNKFRKH